MRAIVRWAAVGLLGSTGCAATGAAGRPSALVETNLPSVRVGEERVVGTRINPLVPVHVTRDGSAIEVTFGKRGRETVARLDPDSLDLLSEQQGGHAEAPAPPSTAATRVALGGGRFLECWTEASGDGGRRAMARMWGLNGLPRGAAVAISPPDADVIGAPLVASVDGQHVVATFAVASGGSFQLRAASLEGADPLAASEPVARR